MELFNDSQLQILTERTWDLHVRLNEKINQEGFSFCGHCSNHGRYCVVAEEKEKIIAIRDSLKDLHSILIYIQTENSCQKMKKDEALGRLEARRMHLIDSIHQWPEKNRRKHHVIEELIKFLGDGKTTMLKEEMVEKIDKRKNVNGVFGFLVTTIRFGLEFMVMFAGISSAVQLYKYRQKNAASLLASVDSRKLEFLVTDSKGQFDVLCGRG